MQAVVGRLFSFMPMFSTLTNLHSFPAGDKLWWADQGTDQIGTCDKKDGENWRVMRNNTSPMMHMRIYDEEVQQGEKLFCCDRVEVFKSNRFSHRTPFFSPLSAGINLCSNNNGDCSQLCLPTSPTTRSCMCTAGYSLKSGQQSCVGKKFTAAVAHDACWQKSIRAAALTSCPVLSPSRYGLLPALLRPRGNPRNPTRPCRQI